MDERGELYYTTYNIKFMEYALGFGFFLIFILFLRKRSKKDGAVSDERRQGDKDKNRDEVDLKRW